MSCALCGALRIVGGVMPYLLAAGILIPIIMGLAGGIRKRSAKNNRQIDAANKRHEKKYGDMQTGVVGGFSKLQSKFAKKTSNQQASETFSDQAKLKQFEDQQPKQ